MGKEVESNTYFVDPEKSVKHVSFFDKIKKKVKLNQINENWHENMKILKNFNIQNLRDSSEEKKKANGIINLTYRINAKRNAKSKRQNKRRKRKIR